MTTAPTDSDSTQTANAVGIRSSALFGFVGFELVTLAEANECLASWGHKMGPINRGNQGATCHALIHEGNAVAVTTASNLIAPVVGGGCQWMTRDNTIELSRLCAARGGLCRVALRLWREFVFPAMGYEFAVSYQDADLHNGNTYRFDGWERVGRARSGTDTRSGRPGRDKWVWAWPGKPNVDVLAPAGEKTTNPLETMSQENNTESTPESGLLQPRLVRQEPRPEDLTPGIRGFDCGDCGKPVEPRYASKKCDGWHWHRLCWERFNGIYSAPNATLSHEEGGKEKL